ncbi:hypothetical protein JCM10207_008624 [Rhodosporidiobolus poonsookiae]
MRISDIELRPWPERWSFRWHASFFFALVLLFEILRVNDNMRPFHPRPLQPVLAGLPLDVLYYCLAFLLVFPPPINLVAVLLDRLLSPPPRTRLEDATERLIRLEQLRSAYLAHVAEAEKAFNSVGWPSRADPAVFVEGEQLARLNRRLLDVAEIVVAERLEHRAFTARSALFDPRAFSSVEDSTSSGTDPTTSADAPLTAHLLPLLHSACRTLIRATPAYSLPSLPTALFRNTFDLRLLLDLVLLSWRPRLFFFRLAHRAHLGTLRAGAEQFDPRFERRGPVEAQAAVRALVEEVVAKTDTREVEKKLPVLLEKAQEVLLERRAAARRERRVEEVVVEMARAKAEQRTKASDQARK